jgi:hypothetical protein
MASAGRTRSRPARRWRRRSLLTVLAICVALALSSGWVAYGGSKVRSDLLSATNLATQLSQQVESGDITHARQTLAALQEQTAGAHGTTTGPAWWAAARAPYAGRDIAAIRDIAACVDDLVQRTIAPLINLNLAGLLPSQGRLDVAALRGAEPAIAGAQASTRAVQERLDAVETAGLLAPVRDGVLRLRTQVARLATLTTAARQGAALLPALLGADGPRTYLLLLQNLAESRSTGGMFGAYAVLRADSGRLTLLAHGASGDLGTFARPVLPVSADDEAIYSDRLGMFPADANLTPDFPSAATYFREMYRRRTDVTVDGVLATDPVALSYLLDATGPVTLPSGPVLTATNAVSTLLSRPYQRIASATDRHDYFGASLTAVFDTVLHRALDLPALLSALSRAGHEHRLLLWSAHPADEAALAGTPLAGILPATEAIPTVGVFLNDASGSKLDYYLTHAATLTVGACRTDGRRELDLRVTLGSSAPATGLTDGVLGLKLGATPYTARVVVYLFSPANGSLVSARLDARAIPLAGGSQDGRQVGALTIDVGPGQHRVLDVILLTSTVPTATARLSLTPGVAPWVTRIKSAPVCA